MERDAVLKYCPELASCGCSFASETAEKARAGHSSPLLHRHAGPPHLTCHYLLLQRSQCSEGLEGDSQSSGQPPLPMCVDTSKPRTSASAAVTCSPSLSQPQSSQLLRCSRSCSTGAALCTWPGTKRLLGRPGAWSHRAAQAPSCCCNLHFCRTLGIPLKKAQFEFRRCQIRGISFKLHPAPQALPTVMGTGLLLLFLLSEVHPGQENCPKG